MGTPLGRVRGLGSARSGAKHWWHERLSAFAALLLWVWFAVSLLRLPSLGHEGVTAWLGRPLSAVLMILLVATTFWHLKLGLQVILEDYVHDGGAKLFWVALINLLAVLGAALAIFAILSIAFAAGAATGAPPAGA